MNMSVREKNIIEKIYDWALLRPTYIGAPVLILLYPFAWIHNQFKEESND